MFRGSPPIPARLSPPTQPAPTPPPPARSPPSSLSSPPPPAAAPAPPQASSAAHSAPRGAERGRGSAAVVASREGTHATGECAAAAAAAGAAGEAMTSRGPSGRERGAVHAGGACEASGGNGAGRGPAAERSSEGNNGGKGSEAAVQRGALVAAERRSGEGRGGEGEAGGVRESGGEVGRVCAATEQACGGRRGGAVAAGGTKGGSEEQGGNGEAVCRVACGGGASGVGVRRDEAGHATASVARLMLMQELQQLSDEDDEEEGEGEGEEDKGSPGDGKTDVAMGATAAAAAAAAEAAEAGGAAAEGDGVGSRAEERSRVMPRSKSMDTRGEWSAQDTRGEWSAQDTRGEWSAQDTRGEWSAQGTRGEWSAQGTRGVRQAGGQREVKLRLSSAHPPCRLFSPEDLAAATLSFHPERLLGQGAYGPVYRGELDDGVAVAVKRMKARAAAGAAGAVGVAGGAGAGEQKREERRGGGGVVWEAEGEEESSGVESFEREVEVLSRVKHDHIVQLIGKPSPAVSSSAPDTSAPQPLLWQHRVRIAHEIASGLLYLHRSQPPMIHRDLKPANVLLSGHDCSKIADVGIACALANPFATSVKTHRVRGTVGFIAPEAIASFELSPRSDVYSFRILLLMLLTGFTSSRSVHDMLAQATPPGRPRDVEVAVALFTARLDKRAGRWDLGLARRVVRVGVRCVERCAEMRPDLEEEVEPELREVAREAVGQAG
ncbi:unnamed protein product [Closterium sp. Yama58-4]|nr:unnamed protein product [Closterium sp. Yama58-4]